MANREIKFRIRDKETGKFQTIGLQNGLPSNWQEHYDVDEYTGLYDKNGKEIYEGDIVNWYINGAIRTGVVVYLPDGGMYDLKHLYDDLHVCNDWLRGEYKVIGNRYENPELMEVVNGN